MPLRDHAAIDPQQGRAERGQGTQPHHRIAESERGLAE